MAIQSSINAMLGTIAGGLTAKSIVGKSINTTDENVGNDANARAKAIYMQKRQRRNKFGQFQTGKQFMEVNK